MVDHGDFPSMFFVQGLDTNQFCQLYLLTKLIFSKFVWPPSAAIITSHLDHMESIKSLNNYSSKSSYEAHIS